MSSIKKGKKIKAWAESRQALAANVKKYPNLLLDVIDSAYLAGLEAKLKEAK